jgi:hypothetical protein
VPPTSAARAKPGRSVGAAPGYTDATAPPTIRATGSDYTAIVRSLFAYRDWLFAHHPDPALVAQVLRQGTTTYARDVADLAALRSKRRTLVSIDQRLTFTVASVQGWQMTLRVHQAQMEDRVLDIQGRVVSATPYPAEDFVFVMTHDGTDRWRIADMTQVDLDPTIVLSP